MSKVLVIGLDGSSWDLVNLLIEKGRLPNIQRLKREGVSATLESTHPAHSAPAWTTFVTGVHPTQHGCFDFLVVRNDIDDLDIIDSAHIPQETIYETMVRHGRQPLLINLPNTFPPKLRDTITITSLMTRGDKYIYPQTLVEKYPVLKRYRLNPNAKLRAQNRHEPYVRDVVQLERDRIASAKELFQNEPWDFFFFLSSGTDWVSHVVYDKALREQQKYAWEVWEVMDEFIGWVRNHMDRSTTLFVMSDHGFRVYDRIFYMNRWLEEEGLLATTKGTGSFQRDHTKLSQEISRVQRKKMHLPIGKTVRRLLATSPVVERSAKQLYHSFIKKYLPIHVTVNLKLDLEKTTVAFPRGSQASMLYVNDTGRFRHGTVTPQHREEVIRSVQQRLLAITDRDRRRVVTKAVTAKELHGEATLPLSPDLFLESQEFYLSGSLHSPALFEEAIKNYHDADGMVIAYGNGIEPRTISHTDIVNFAPTILHTMGLPVQSHCTGTVMDIFSQSWQQQHPIEREMHEERFALKSFIDHLTI